MFDFIARNQTSDTDVGIIWLHPSGGNFQSEGWGTRRLIETGHKVFYPNGPFWHGYNQMARVWYHQIKDDFVEDKQVYASLAAMERFVTRLKRGFGVERVILAGFSNGGSFAAMCALMLPQLFEFVWDFAGYIPRTEDFTKWLTGNHSAREYLRSREKPLPLTISHGYNDFVNEYWCTLAGYEDAVGAEGLDLYLMSHNDGHSVNAAGMAKLVEDIKELSA